jgi:CheY-like chemotaxis protein
MALPARQLEEHALSAPRGASDPRWYRGNQARQDAPGLQAAPESSQACRVLLVEDEEAIAELYATVLKANGHLVTHAVDGLAGLDAIRSGQFDLILLDIRMPRMDGLAMLRQIVAEQIATNTPVVILTNYDDPILRQEAADLGAKDYLLKSRTMPREIAAQVEKWCR